MSVLTPSTELEAVNAMLLSIGQSPVNSVEGATIGDAALALRILRDTTRTLQGRAWYWNRDRNYVLPVDASGIIRCPLGFKSIDATASTTAAAVRLHPDGYYAMWNQATNAWTWETSLTVNIVWAFSYTALPPVAQDYVTAAAGRRFQAKIVGSPLLHRFDLQDEQAAWDALVSDDSAVKDVNFFRRNARARATLRRSY